MIKYDKLALKIKARYPNSQIKYKDESKFWKFMPEVWQQNAMCLSPNTIWMPSRKTKSFSKLAHEYQHLVDWNELGRLGFLWIYLTPQLYSMFLLIFALLAFGFELPIFSVILLIIGLGFLLPWPSRGRAHLEMKGYLMSLYVYLDANEDIYYLRKNLIDVLKSWLYYKMVWTSSRAHHLIHEAEEKLANKADIPKISPAFEDVYEILTN